MGDVTIGCDIGQKKDPTAIAVVEKDERLSGRARTRTRKVYRLEEYRVIGAGGGFVTQMLDPHKEEAKITEHIPILENHYLVRHLERLPLGTTYPHVVDRLEDVIAQVIDRTGEWPAVYVDATGVGQPIVDLIDASGIKGFLYAVYFTHGDRLNCQGRQIVLGKAYLVSRLQVLLQGGRVHLPSTSEARVLAKELLDYEIKVDERANDTYGAFRVGSHDDLVTALGLAVVHEPVSWGVA